MTRPLSQYIPSTSSLTVDISSTYNFSLHIIATDLQPDLLWWDEARKHLTMIKLTVCFETNFVDAATRKAAKHHHLLDQAQTKGYKAKLIALQVGSRGVQNLHGIGNQSVPLREEACWDTGGLIQASPCWVLLYLVLQKQISLTILLIVYLLLVIVVQLCVCGDFVHHLGI